MISINLNMSTFTHAYSSLLRSHFYNQAIFFSPCRPTFLRRPYRSTPHVWTPASRPSTPNLRPVSKTFSALSSRRDGRRGQLLSSLRRSQLDQQPSLGPSHQHHLIHEADLVILHHHCKWVWHVGVVWKALWLRNSCRKYSYFLYAS